MRNSERGTRKAEGRDHKGTTFGIQALAFYNALSRPLTLFIRVGDEGFVTDG